MRETLLMETNHKEVFKAITARLSNPSGIVQVTTYLRSTIYTHKHLAWFSHDAKGVYVQHGKGKVAIHLSSIRLGEVR